MISAATIPPSLRNYAVRRSLAQRRRDLAPSVAAAKARESDFGQRLQEEKTSPAQALFLFYLDDGVLPVVFEAVPPDGSTTKPGALGVVVFCIDVPPVVAP
jgi:hypothetical protein